jgi:hypothetical protein
MVNVRIASLELKTLESVKTLIGTQTRTVIIDHFYSNHPEPTSDSAEECLKIYCSQLEIIAQQLKEPEMVDDNARVHSGIKLLISYLEKHQLEPTKDLREQIDILANGIVQRVTLFSENNPLSLSRYLEHQKEKYDKFKHTTA